MAKTTAPLISFEARGKVASQQIFQRSKSRNIAKSYASPRNPQSAAQVADRSYVTTAVKSWRSYFQNAAVLEAWDRSSNQGKRTTTGYNQAIGALKTALKTTAAPAFHYGPHTKLGNLYSVPMLDAATGLPSVESGFFDIYVGTKPSNLQRYATGTLAGSILSFYDIPAPPVTTGVQLWLDASQITGYADGQEMTSWLDASQQGRHYSRPAAGQGCHYYTTGAGGRPYCSFNGTSDWMRGSTWLKSFTSFDAYFAVTPLTPLTDSFLLSQGVVAGGLYGTRIMGVQRAANSWITHFTNGAVYQGACSVTALPYDSPVVLRFALDAAGGFNSRNGIAGATAASLYPMPDNVGSTYSTIGRPFPDGAWNYYKGAISELLCYSPKLSDADADRTTQYLMSKYDIPPLSAAPTIWSYFQIIKNAKRRSGIIKV